MWDEMIGLIVGVGRWPGPHGSEQWLENRSRLRKVAFGMDKRSWGVTLGCVGGNRYREAVKAVEAAEAAEAAAAKQSGESDSKTGAKKKIRVIREKPAPDEWVLYPVAQRIRYEKINVSTGIKRDSKTGTAQEWIPPSDVDRIGIIRHDMKLINDAGTRPEECTVLGVSIDLEERGFAVYYQGGSGSRSGARSGWITADGTAAGRFPFSRSYVPPPSQSERLERAAERAANKKHDQTSTSASASGGDESEEKAKRSHERGGAGGGGGRNGRKPKVGPPINDLLDCAPLLSIAYNRLNFEKSEIESDIPFRIEIVEWTPPPINEHSLIFC